ncbi:ABC transporter ATP-binding protein [Nesterenkonia muleiensis]|uniref:ABC transporter ATP-binding protein n=1 Tax=Nesterenkonia muleiensis TaxID=2282648 RepID=UPI000E71EF76|nr:ABC transporter ATP-binding protein [Nesterenkonia muleiensis]
MTELRIEKLTVRYGRGPSVHTAADEVSLTVPASQTLGLVGESGSGKSTVARAAAGLVSADSGTIKLGGKPLPRRGLRPVQMIFQDPRSSLDPRMSIGESIAECLPSRFSRSARRSEISRLLDMVHLDPTRRGARPPELSGGQLQRVAIARVLAARPAVVVADEITSALDVSVQGAVLNLVRELQTELGLSLLFISHNLAVVRYVASQVAVMRTGRILEAGPADQVFHRPQHSYTRQLLDAVPDTLRSTP